jgi:carbon-monoxide dehydrogenase medium subunit
MKGVGVKPGKFEYHAPTTVGEAAALLKEHADDCKVIAGGQSLVPMMSLRLASPSHLIDLNRIGGLDTIGVHDGQLRIGAMVRQSVAEHDALIASNVPLVAKAIPHIGHFQIRNRGTIGGSIAHADPASELPAVALALDAVIEADGPAGRREIAARDFFVSTWATTLSDDEILTGIRFPVWSGKCGFACEEVARRHGDFALVGAVVGVSITDQRVDRAAIALFGVGTTPVRASAAEEALIRDGVSADLALIGRTAADPLSPTGDLHASAAYRKQVAATVVRRALANALEEARS